MHPDYPVIEGEVRLTEHWQTNLPVGCNRRIEDGDLVLWRPGLTLFFTAWGIDRGESRSSRLEWIRKQASPDAYDFEVTEEAGLAKLTYRLREIAADGREPALYAFAVSDVGHLQMAAYFDEPAHLEVARQVLRNTKASIAI